MRILLLMALALTVLSARAAERVFNLGEYPLDQTPPGFRSAVAGRGKPGDWRVILDEAPPVLQPLTSKAPSVSRRAVLAQLARDPANDHFPLLIFNDETYGDFKLSTRFKIVGGSVAQMAGMVFRFQNETNFYVLAASSLDNRFWFFKVIDGVRGPLIGPQVTVPAGEWHELAVECEGNHIHCLLDRQELIPMMTDNSLGSGKIGFWTKSDSVSYFADTKVSYTRKDGLAQKLVREAIKEYPRLLGLKIYATPAGGKGPVVVASKVAEDLGRPAGEAEQDVIRQGKAYLGRSKGSVSVTVPLRDRNGDPIAAVWVLMKSFPGQTEDNAAARAQPVVQRMQAQVQTLEDLLQ